MTMRALMLLTALATLGACAPDQADKRTQPIVDPLVAKGETLYARRCGPCHSVNQDRLGPRHRGVYGRTAGTVPGFDYSDALKNSGIVWTEETLDPWLTDARLYVKGAEMEFTLPSAEERTAIIAYLKTLAL